jgi:small GTP-binding protein
MNHVDFVFKILLIGDSGVGKSSILLQYTDNFFNENQNSTIGVDFRVKVLTIEEGGKTCTVKATLWDTAGQERFRTLTAAYYRGAHGVIFVYDVGRMGSFKALDSWARELQDYAPDGGAQMVKVLLGNKADQKKEVDDGLAVSWAEEHNMKFLVGSAKTNQRIDDVFEAVIRDILNNPELMKKMSESKRMSEKVSVESQSGMMGGCC